MRAAFYTFGCKLNQFETEALASAFRGRGFPVVEPEEAAEIYLINTCTVTTKSEQKARRYIRHLSRQRPNALLLVTGCYAQLEREALTALGANVAVVSQDLKGRLLELPRQLEGPGWRERAVAYIGSLAEAGSRDPFRFQVERFSFHSRAFLKIQDGCDHRCAYCRVPLARGGSVSLEPALALERARQAELSGHREIVLTGVNISSYRHGELDLAGLLRRILAGTERARLRLSSIEPESVEPVLSEILRHPRICPHFHLPVQSGSDAVLLSMRRRYKAAQVVRAVELLREAKADPFLAADLIAGFPGETEEQFQATRGLAESLRFSKLHVFPFSPRPGTAAFRMGAHVPERIRDQRVRELVALSERLEEEYRELWVGREVEVVLEKRAGSEEAWQGTSENYLKIAVPGIPAGVAVPGRMLRVRIEEPGDPCSGRFLAAP